MRYVCSNCGEPCYYDGRCGDDPVLICDCIKESYWINDRIGGYFVYKNNAHPVTWEEYIKNKK